MFACWGQRFGWRCFNFLEQLAIVAEAQANSLAGAETLGFLGLLLLGFGNVLEQYGQGVVLFDPKDLGRVLHADRVCLAQVVVHHHFHDILLV